MSLRKFPLETGQFTAPEIPGKAALLTHLYWSTMETVQHLVTRRLK
jgi:hypothetical protein